MDLPRGVRRREIKIKTSPVLKKIIQFFGSQRHLARKLNLTQAAIHGWIKRSRVPAKWAKKIEKLTNNEITRQQIRPDLFS